MRTNKYRAPCHHCRAMVAAGRGQLSKIGRFWKVAHLDCQAEYEHMQDFGVKL